MRKMSGIGESSAINNPHPMDDSCTTWRERKAGKSGKREEKRDFWGPGESNSAVGTELKERPLGHGAERLCGGDLLSYAWKYEFANGYRLAIFWAMYRSSLRSSSSALLSKRRSLLR